MSQSASGGTGVTSSFLQMNNVKSFIMVLVLASSVTGCTKFKESDCIQHVDKGWVWRITEVHFRKYTMQAWFDGEWGKNVEASSSKYNSRYVKIFCPFSIQVQKGE